MPKKKQSNNEKLVADLMSVGKSARVDTVNFSDPNRPKTCLEVDFPILPVNHIAGVETNARKPIFTMSKWFAPRVSSAFRAILLSASIKAPQSPERADNAVWDVFYANHQLKKSLSTIKVVDIFMGGGTTVVEASRLGMQAYGVDLNPVAWFKVKNQFSDVTTDEINSLLQDIEKVVRPQIIPFFACNAPDGTKGRWTHLPTNTQMPETFDHLRIPISERALYSYEGPEIVYTFWAKHGPCSVTGCGHRTPILGSPVIANKAFAVRSWAQPCEKCGQKFEIENKVARMAPEVPLVLTDSTDVFAPLDESGSVSCPFCSHRFLPELRSAGDSKKIELTLLLHPAWQKGITPTDEDGIEYGGGPHDTAVSTIKWNRARAKTCKLIEVRGPLPERLSFPGEELELFTDNRGGTVLLKDKKDKAGNVVKDKDGRPIRIAERSSFVCGGSGHPNDVLEAVKQTKKAAPMAAYAIQGYYPNPQYAYGGRFFAPFSEPLAEQYNAAVAEWEKRKETDLAQYWPRTEIPIGEEIGPHDVEGHHYTHWWTMFNPRQLLILSQMLKAILEVGAHRWEVREFVLGSFQQYLRNQNMFCIWDQDYDKLVPHYSKDNFHPKNTVVENTVFSSMGRGNWTSCTEAMIDARNWASDPWDLVSVEDVKRLDPALSKLLKSKSVKVRPKDPVQLAQLSQGTATDLAQFENNYFDLVITDPPFSGLIQYAELADFFYVWLRIGLKDKYPQIFGTPLTLKSLECVANKARHPGDSEAFYKRLLTQSWRESFRILKPAGILAFTFHHDKDEPWVTVLESLFEAGFYLEATYPIRSDESKGDGDFGSQKIEYDIIHVCRKRTEEPTQVSWAKMRKQVLQDVQQLASILEHHQQEGLPKADLQLIKRGKALEYFSRHYGKVYIDKDRPFTVRDAFIGINQILAEENKTIASPPPGNADPLTQMLLTLFNDCTELSRDQMSKFLRSTIVGPEKFEQKGWCEQRNRIYYLTPPLTIAQRWYGRARKNMTDDYDQALFLIGACMEESGINASETLKNENFEPHPALEALLDWHAKKSTLQPVRQAATRALQIFRQWQRSHPDEIKQLSLFQEEE